MLSFDADTRLVGLFIKQFKVFFFFFLLPFSFCACFVSRTTTEQGSLCCLVEIARESSVDGATQQKWHFRCVRLGLRTGRREKNELLELQSRSERVHSSLPMIQ